jgi:hypothetical protein
MLIRETLIDRATEFNIELDDVAITALSFGAEYSAGTCYTCTGAALFMAPYPPLPPPSRDC